jgi:dsDNA-binding SOS-regulon protein
MVSVELEKGKAYVIKTGVEKYLYFRKKRADTDQLVKLAEAEKTLLKNELIRG